MNNNIRLCPPETAEIITNAEHAYLDGEITREQRDEIIMQAIKHDTEIPVLTS